MGFPEAQILRVNLANGQITKEVFPAEQHRLYPGGSALAAYFLLKEMKRGIDPLSADNLLILAVSPLTGLPISGQSRMVIAARSPLTGAIGDSQGGGYFPKELKCNGWDAVIFHGRAQQPVYLAIDGQRAELRSARHLWGKITGEVEEALKREIGQDVEIAQIGPAGEKLVRFACVLNMCNRANGRTGMGAVMGSKNLKAVVVRKQQAAKPLDAEGFKELTANFKERLAENAAVTAFHVDGTGCELKLYNDLGFLPTNNISSGYFPAGAENLDGATMTKTILKTRDTCFGCSVRCKRVVDIPGKVDPKYGGPEYETVAAMGSYCGVTSLENTAVSNQLCNMYGLDTISCGATIAFAMECYEKGLIGRKETGGIDLRFGNGEAVNAVIPLIAGRQGIGDVLAEGSARAAKRFGPGAEKLLMSVKSQEIPAHMPQFKPSLAIMYAVNPFGADHESCEHDPVLSLPPDSLERKRLAQIGLWKGYPDSFSLDEEKVRFIRLTQQFYSITDVLCLCQFCWGPAWALYGIAELVALCRAGIGWETSAFELMKIGERRINLLRAFNAREGFTRAEDRLPQRFFEPLPEGPAKGAHLDAQEYARAQDLYYEMCGWEKGTGNPGQSKLRELSLGWLADELGH
jgi:aldehyde:ferredoxin oxidoreductase